ncbi:DNA polymerase [Frankliniella fusca]|uniref:DNA polymerase n=1 Tax=Frankliniella fusca TaxID=407009 RepID=A0AAE1HJZ1_9NEOP|nr:DNA polymerase [Frankliniella fusca]
MRRYIDFKISSLLDYIIEFVLSHGLISVTSIADQMQKCELSSSNDLEVSLSVKFVRSA